MIALDVRVHVRPVFAGVHAMGTLETRRLTAFVFQMSVKSSIPFVGLLTLGAIEATSGSSVRCWKRSSVVACSPPIRSHGDRHVRQCGQVEHHWKLYGSFLDE